MLLTAARKAADGAVDDEAIVARVTGLLRAFDLPDALVAQGFGLRDALRAVAAGREATPALTDLVASFGEHLRFAFVAAALRARASRRRRTTFDVGVVTDDHFGGADVVAEAEALMAERVTAPRDARRGPRGDGLHRQDARRADHHARPRRQ